jgi:phosphomannomutase
LFGALFLLDLLRKRGEPLAELRHALPQIHSTPELRIPALLLPYARACEALAAAMPDASVRTRIDGLRFETGDGIVLVRESGTEPVLSVRIEGFTTEGLERMVAKCVEALPEASMYIRREPAETAAD